MTAQRCRPQQQQPQQQQPQQQQPAATPADFRVPTEAAPGAALQTFTAPPVPGGKPFLLKDLFLQNPHGDVGILQVRRGDAVLLEVGLANFRDLDYHWLQPLRFGRDQPVVVAVKCENPETPYRPAASFSGAVEG